VWWRKQKKKAREAFDESALGQQEDDDMGSEGEPDTEETRLQSIWEMVDADSSGVLDEAELKQVFVAMGQNLEGKKFAKAFKQIDVDGEGSIDFAELLVWWRKQKAKDLKKFDESKLQAGESGAEGGEGKGGEPDEAEARLKTIWNIVDTDASGSLDEAEIRRVFVSMGEKWASDDKPSAAKKFAKAFKAMDSDGGGEISFEELLVWWRKQKGKATTGFEDRLGAAGMSAASGGEDAGPDPEEQRLRTIWDIVDGDSSGALDRAEVGKVFEAMGQNLNEKKLAKAFKAMDSDGGGEISFEELLAWWRKQKGKAKAAFDGISQSNPLFGAALAQGPGPLRAEWALAGTQCGCFTRCNTTRG
jgi:Ca2+-binding EF-hand superfamily protein